MNKTEKTVCPFCGKVIEFNAPEPEVSTFFDGKVICGECKKEVKLVVLPKFDARPIMQ